MAAFDGTTPRGTARGVVRPFEAGTAPGRPRQVAVDVDTRNGFQVGNPHPLFDLPARSFSPSLATWDVDPAGNRFFIVSPDQRAQSTAAIEVITDFSSLVNRR